MFILPSPDLLERPSRRHAMVRDAGQPMTPDADPAVAAAGTVCSFKTNAQGVYSIECYFAYNFLMLWRPGHNIEWPSQYII
jgi:hypothetical protein